MKKINKFLLLGIIIILSTPVFGFNKERNDSKLMMDMLEEIDASFEEGEITICEVLRDEFIDTYEMFEIGKSIRKELGIKGSILYTENFKEESPKEGYYLVQLNQEKALNQLLIKGFDEKNSLISINLSSYKNQKDSIEETSLFINLINNEQFIENNDIIVRAMKIFDEFDKEINITSCMLGSINGNIDMYEKEEEILGGLNKIKGEVVEEYRDDKLVSLSIYTPLIEEYIYTGNNKMNLNIVIRNNEEDNKINIIIGTPIITSGY